MQDDITTEEGVLKGFEFRWGHDDGSHDMIEKGRSDFWADFKFSYRTLFLSIYHAQVKTLENR